MFTGVARSVRCRHVSGSFAVLGVRCAANSLNHDLAGKVIRDVLHQPLLSTQSRYFSVAVQHADETRILGTAWPSESSQSDQLA